MADLSNGAVRRICVRRLRGTLEILGVALEQCFDPVAARIEQGVRPGAAGEDSTERAGGNK